MKRANVIAALGLGLALAAFAARAAAQEDDLEVPASPHADAGATPSRVEELEARIRALEARTDAAAGPTTSDAGALPSEGTPPPPAHSEPAEATPTPVRDEGEPSLVAGLTGPLGLVFSGYIQAQYESSQLSEDQLQQGGIALNQDRFLVRRARLRVDRAWTWASTTLEVDGNTNRGASFGLRRAEVSLVWRNPEREAPPWVRLTAGLSEIPFGYEMTESSRARFFMERSTGSLALFPGEPDLGLRLSGGIGFFRYAVAALNGEPIDDRPGRINGDPNTAKDLVARFGVDVKPRNELRIAGGISLLTGKGFHAGRDATKNGVIWRDLNENGAIDNGELTAVPGTAATPSANFTRWAFGADLQLSVRTPIGSTRVLGEIFAAQNADRGLVIADPVASGSDVREVGFYAGLTQEIGRYGIVGFRTDHYNPNADLLDKRRGRLIPVDASIHTYSPIAGLLLPDRARLVVQYDVIVDTLGRDREGVPTDLANNRLTIRLQGEL